MRELTLLEKLNRTYRAMGLSYGKLIWAVAMMGATSLLEMSGLSIIYPLVLMMGGGQTRFAGFPILASSGLSPDTQILLLLSGIAVLYVAKNIALYFSYQSNIGFAIYYYRHMIRSLYGAHVHKPLLEFQQESAGSLSNLICVQTEKLIDGVVRPMMVIVTETMILAGITTLVIFINPSLIAAIILGCGSAVGLYYALLRARSHAWGRHYMGVASSLQELVGNTAAGISEIKVFAKERYLTERLHEISGEKTRMFHHLEMYQQGPRFLVETAFVVTVMIFFSALLLSGTAPATLLAQFSVVAAASFRILPSINRVISSYSNFSFHVGPATVLLDTILDSGLLTQDSSWTDEPRSADKAAPPHAESVAVSDVTFAYPLGNRVTLDGINLTVRCGQKVGLMGSSGSGKSTLLKIIAGLIRPTGGAILVDGGDISKDLKSWQSRMGYVPQESFILPGTIRENIAFGTRDGALSEERTWEILRTCGLAHFVRTLPDGLETRIGEKGIRLSGGQRQLVCLARALIRDPSILLLDEPTASLDSANERLVLQAIQGIPRNTMVVMASHKLENFRGFDAIYSFDPASKRFLETSSWEAPSVTGPRGPIEFPTTESRA